MHRSWVHSSGSGEEEVGVVKRVRPSSTRALLPGDARSGAVKRGAVAVELAEIRPVRTTAAVSIS